MTVDETGVLGWVRTRAVGETQQGSRSERLRYCRVDDWERAFVLTQLGRLELVAVGWSRSEVPAKEQEDKLSCLFVGERDTAASWFTDYITLVSLVSR